jgi:hypothetical protein
VRRCARSGQHAWVGPRGQADREVTVCLCLGSDNYRRAVHRSWDCGSMVAAARGVLKQSQRGGEGELPPISGETFPLPKKTLLSSCSCVPAHRHLPSLAPHGGIGAISGYRGRDPEDGGGRAGIGGRLGGRLAPLRCWGAGASAQGLGDCLLHRLPQAGARPSSTSLLEGPPVSLRPLPP